jgi:8-amino-7-oxononanoate synthase
MRLDQPSGRRFGLSAADKASLLAGLRQSAPVERAVASAAASAIGPDLTDLTAHPLYRQTRTQRGAIEVFGLGNPYLREHEDRAGATTRIAGRTVANFSSYDYLALNQNPAVAQAAKQAIDQFGTSVSASRIVAGERPIHRALERALAAHYACEDAIVYVSGHATNVSTIATLLGPKDLVVYDALSHNSIMCGAELSGATRRAFPHGDYVALEAILAESRSRVERVLIVVEGLYSMDGDVPDLARLAAIKRRWGAWLMVDEAHALGVLGDSGRGTAEQQGVAFDDIDIWMGTLSKTLASCGGYIAGKAELIDLLKHHAAGFVFSVGLSPPLAGAALAALDLLHREPERVHKLAANGARFLAEAKRAGLDTGHGQGHAVAPVMVGDSLKAVALSERLLGHGFNVLPIVFPAVPMQSARLRFFLSSGHSFEQIDDAVAATKLELDGLEKSGFSVEAMLAAIPQQHG